ncbi:MAG TPA: transporter substrate-binding domain-containing protein [Pyrinomonadaceae bacterium]|nr:transporter substrate-binding domain-containing protein [Pyrinomonadaceae bacterium]
MKSSQCFSSRLFHICLARFLCAVSILLLNTSLVRPQVNSIIVAVEDGAAPWSRSDGTGYANDVVVAAFKAVGVDVDLRVVPYARCKRMALNGEVLACFSTSPAPELAGLLELSAQPLFSFSAGYFYNVNKPVKATRQENLPPKTVVGTVIGYEYPPSFDRLKQQGIVVVEESPSEDINLRKLAAGRIDLALLTYNDMKTPKFLIQRAGVSGQVQTTFQSGMMNSYIAFSTKHSQGGWAKQEFDKGFATISRNGTLKRIKSKWSRALTT